jgi:hypothetical protein
VGEDPKKRPRCGRPVIAEGQWEIFQRLVIRYDGFGENDVALATCRPARHSYSSLWAGMRCQSAERLPIATGELHGALRRSRTAAALKLRTRSHGTWGASRRPCSPRIDVVRSSAVAASGEAPYSV